MRLLFVTLSITLRQQRTDFITASLNDDLSIYHLLNARNKTPENRYNFYITIPHFGMRAFSA